MLFALHCAQGFWLHLEQTFLGLRSGLEGRRVRAEHEDVSLRVTAGTPTPSRAARGKERLSSGWREDHCTARPTVAH